MARARSKTKLSSARAQKIIEGAIEILQNFYRSQIDNQLKFSSAEIVDSINNSVEMQISEQTIALTSVINKSIEAIVDDIAKEKHLPHILTKTVAI